MVPASRWIYNQQRLTCGYHIGEYSWDPIFPGLNEVILIALKRYEMSFADNGSSVFFSGVPDKGGAIAICIIWARYTAGNFEAVDESSWQMLVDSGRVDAVAVK